MDLAPEYRGVVESQSSPPPGYTSGISFELALQAWNEVDAASQALPEHESELSSLDEQLRKHKALATQLKEKSSALFNAMQSTRSSSLAGLFRKNKTNTSGSVLSTTANQEYQEAHKAESEQQVLVAKLAQEHDALQQKVSKLRSEAALLEDRFARMRGAAESVVYPSDRIDLQISEADEVAERLALAYHTTEATLKDVTRARLTLQHAHHYHEHVLKLSDTIRGSALGKTLTTDFITEYSKNIDYKAAIKTAVKAEACLTEGIKMLRQHLELVPEDIQVQSDTLSELGLMQISRVYDLMYGGKGNGPSDVGQKVKLLYERQEKAFASLTMLAVWVQKKVPELEEDLKTVMDRLRKARQTLVQLWIETHQPSPAT